MRRPALFLFLLLAVWMALGLPRLMAQGSRTAFLQVAGIEPFPGQPLALDEDISFHFNRRVDCATARAAFQTAPFVDGTLGCDEYTLTFSPAGTYQHETEYAFSLMASIAALDGATMPDPYRASYTTAGFLQIAEVFPTAQAASVPTDSDIIVVFDRPVVPLPSSADSGGLPQPLQLSPAAEGIGEWANSSVYVFTPTEALRGGTDYTASIAGLAAPDGSILENDFVWRFQTAAAAVVGIAPPPDSDALPLNPRIQLRFNQSMNQGEVEQAFYLRQTPSNQNVTGRFEWTEDGQGLMFKPDLQLETASVYELGLNGESWSYTTVPLPSIRKVEPHSPGEVVIVFASPMNIDTLADKISIAPPPDAAPHFYYSDWDSSYWISFTAQPSTDYTITVAPGMEDIYGHAISQRQTFSYAAPPLEPEFGIRSAYEVGFYDARRSPTQVHIYQRNADVIDVHLYRVPVDDFAAGLTDEDYVPPTESYVPQDDLLLRQWRIESDAPPNETRDELLALGQLDPGLYYLAVDTPGIEQPYWQKRHFLNVATAVLTVKQAASRITVWATDVQSGQPIIGETISLYDSSQRVIASATTHQNGIARLDIPLTRNLYTRFVAILDSERHFGVGYSEWTHGLESHLFGCCRAYHVPAFQSYLYTDRPVYRPGQTVYFRGIVRSKDDVAYALPPLERALVVIRDGRGDIAYQQALPLSDFGSFSDSFDIAPNAAPGAYTLLVDLPAESDYFREGSDIGFLVAEYRTPDYQVKAQAVTPQIAQGESATFALEGRYFFGGKVSDAAVDYMLAAQPYVFQYQGERDYDFVDADDDDEGFYDNLAAEGMTRTDENGKTLIEVPGGVLDKTQSQVLRLEAGLRDESGGTVFSRADVVVHQGLVYVGLRAESYVGQAHQDSAIDIIAVDWDSRPVAGQRVDVEVVERRWLSRQEQDPNTGATGWIWEVEDIPVTRGAVQTDADGKARFSYVPPRGGIYKIIVSAHDEAGRQVRAATFAWAADSSHVAWHQDNAGAVELIAAQTSYSIGDRARILIASPYQGRSEALVTIERGGIISAEHITMQGNSQIYEFEVLPEHAPNIYVSVFIVKAVDEAHPAASYRMGMTRLPVDIEQKELKIDIHADHDRAAPQETVAYKLRVTNYKGEPVAAELGVALSDLASLSLVDEKSPTMLETFYGAQELAVRTSSSLTVSADSMNASLSNGKGGGGIADESSLERRGEFIDTPYWNPAVLTDAAGEAVVHVRLPDNLTTWRLDVRAVTAGRDGVMLVGQERFDLLSAEPLIIRPVTPRFFVVGDRALLSAVVHNSADRDVAARVSLENMDGLRLADGAGQARNVTIPAQGRTRTSWLVEVGDVESVAPFFAVRSDDNEYADASISPVADADGRLPVYRYQSPETVGASGALITAGTRVEALLMPRGFDVKAGRLDVQIDRSLAAVVKDSLDYPGRDGEGFWACTATLVGRFLPHIAAFRALNHRPPQQAKLDALVAESLPELYARQRADGGWSWCYHPQSDALASAYALIGLAAAKQPGYAVDDAVIRRARDYLRSQLITPSRQAETWRLNRQAFLLYALAFSGTPDIPRSAALFESRERLNLDAIAFLANTLHIIDPDDEARLDALAQFMLNRAVTRASGSFFEEAQPDRRNGSTHTRSTALALDALVKIRPESDLLPNIVRHLVSLRRAGHWPSHQDNVWSVIALTNWMLARGELQPDYAFQVAVNGGAALEGLALPETALEPVSLHIDAAGLIQRETNLVELSRGDGDGTLYYTAHLTLDLPAADVESQNRGIDISRRYTRLGEQTPIVSAAVGDAVQARLRVVVPNSLHYVVIEDVFPAGAEAVDPNLVISQQSGTAAQGGRIDPRRDGWGWWHFDHIEFHDEKAVIYASHLPRGVYEYVYTIRPKVEGVYNVLPPFAQELHFPEVYGRGEGMLFTISGAQD